MNLEQVERRKANWRKATNKYRAANPEVIKTRKERYRKSEAGAAAIVSNYLETREHILSKTRNNHRILRESLFEILGRYCKRCSFSDVRALQVDHINGGGTKERREEGSGLNALIKRVKRNPENYQILCANCNWIKRHENNEQRLNRKYAA